MFSIDKLREIEKKKKEWQEGTLKQSLKRFKASESPNRFYTPLDIPDFDFLEKVGFPGDYPYTASTYPSMVPGTGPVKGGGPFAVAGLARAGRYSGYATAEDTRDYYKEMIARGWRVGANLAFDLPTQCGYDSDHPMAEGEVGRTGVAIDTLQDMEAIFEPFTGDLGLDKVATNMNINAPAIIMLSMFITVAEKKGVPLNKLRGTPQNDILKEYTGRGTYIFPPKPALRLSKDSFVYLRKNVPSLNIISISAHFRDGGADSVRSFGYQFSNAIAYVQVAQEGGLNVDDFLPYFTLGTGGCHTMEILHSIAQIRASRRVWAKLTRERFKAKDPKSWIVRTIPGRLLANLTTRQRPLNNLTRAVLGGVAIALSGDVPAVGPGYDEPLGLGTSLEAQQLCEDGARILFHEAKLCDVIDPFAGSYYMESLTNQVEQEIWKTIGRIDAAGGAVAAIETGFLQREIAQNAYKIQKEIETGERVIVGVNSFLGPDELEVTVQQQAPHPYDPKRRQQAEEKQIAKLHKIKRGRDNRSVSASLKRLKDAAADEKVNLFPPVIEAVKEYATVGDRRNSTGTIDTDRQFTGQRLDGTGLYYYGARYYDPGIGRFISADSSVQLVAGVRTLSTGLNVSGHANFPTFNQAPFEPQALNRYSYALENPLRYVDPSGEQTVGIGVGFTAGIFGWGVSGSFVYVESQQGGSGFVWSFGAGGFAAKGFGGGGASAGVIVQYTTADRVEQLRGYSVQTGASGGSGIGVGVEYVGGDGYQGINFNAGVGGGFETHGILEKAGAFIIKTEVGDDNGSSSGVLMSSTGSFTAVDDSGMGWALVSLDNGTPEWVTISEANEMLRDEKDVVYVSY